jgi:hypothetical protein
MVRPRQRGWWLVGLVLGLGGLAFLRAAGQESGRSGSAAPAAGLGDAAPAVPRGVEVLARGPVHEAFATPASEPRPTPVIPKKPPAPLEEMPPEERPEGEVVWIAGYWAWDDERQDFLWVSGCWRIKPPGKEWVPGYWREVPGGWQWVPGFWHDTGENGQPREVTYYPEPPPPPQVAPPGDPPAPDTFYVPGYWVWNGERYVWRAGYWARVQPGYVWVPPHYRWTPYGYIYVPGYWDLALPHRGILYAPVVVDCTIVTPDFVYTPVYAVSDVVLLDTLFIRPCCCCYYFGDYYGPRYVALGFESCVLYSRRHYDALIVYACWEHRTEPRWLDVQINLCFARDCGRAPVPPRTLVQQTIVQNQVTNITHVTNITNNQVTNIVNNSTTINKTVINNITQNNTTINNKTINNNLTQNNLNNKTTVVNNTAPGAGNRLVGNMQVLAPARQLAAARGQKIVPVDAPTRLAAKAQAEQLRATAVQQRLQMERPLPPGSRSLAPRTAALQLPPGRTVAPQGGLHLPPAPAVRATSGATGSGGLPTQSLEKRGTAFPGAGNQNPAFKNGLNTINAPAPHAGGSPGKGPSAGNSATPLSPRPGTPGPGAPSASPMGPAKNGAAAGASPSLSPSIPPPGPSGPFGSGFPQAGRNGPVVPGSVGTPNGLRPGYPSLSRDPYGRPLPYPRPGLAPRPGPREGNSPPGKDKSSGKEKN